MNSLESNQTRVGVGKVLTFTDPRDHGTSTLPGLAAHYVLKAKRTLPGADPRDHALSGLVAHHVLKARRT